MFENILNFYFCEMFGEKPPDIIMKPVSGKNGLHTIIMPNEKRPHSLAEIMKVLREPFDLSDWKERKCV
jgi:hypothetical protein